MDEKHLDTQTGRNSSDSCEGKDKDLADIFTSTSSEPSLDEKCVSEASAAENWSSYENCNTCSDDDVGEKPCTVSYAESGIDQSKAINTYENPSCKIEDGYRVFRETEEESSSSIEICASQSSTVNAGELKLIPSPSSLLKNFSIFYLGGVSSGGTTETITVDSNTGLLNPLEKDTGVESCLNCVIHLVENAQNERCFEIANRSSSESDNSEFEIILRNKGAVVTDMTPMNPCPKISPTDDDTVRESLNDISEVMACCKRPNDSEIFSKKDLTPNNREGTSLCLDIPPIDKENYPNETEVNQNRTFKRSLSKSPTGVRESKSMKLSSPSENPTSTLKNNDVNLTKRPVSPDDDSSPESHSRRQEFKKQKIEES